MIRLKKKPTPKPPKERKDPRIEAVYEQEVTFTCPVRGKVTQKVKIKKYKSLAAQAPKHVLHSNELTDKLEEKDDGLSIYSDGEDLGLLNKDQE